MAQDLIEQAHEDMRVHLPAEGDVWCAAEDCGERHPCTRRRDSRSILIREGHLVLTNSVRRA